MRPLDEAGSSRLKFSRVPSGRGGRCQLPGHGRSPPISRSPLTCVTSPMSALSVQDFTTEASMANVRGSRFVTVLAVALLGGFGVLTSGTTFGQEKHKISWTAKAEHTKFPFRQRFEIPDIPGHAIVFFEIRRTWPDGGGAVVAGLKVVEDIAWGMGDGVAGNGLDRGYSVWRYENGDQSF